MKDSLFNKLPLAFVIAGLWSAKGLAGWLWGQVVLVQVVLVVTFFKQIVH